MRPVEQHYLLNLLIPLVLSLVLTYDPIKNLLAFLQASIKNLLASPHFKIKNLLAFPHFTIKNPPAYPHASIFDYSSVLANLHSSAIRDVYSSPPGDPHSSALWDGLSFVLGGAFRHAVICDLFLE